MTYRTRRSSRPACPVLWCPSDAGVDQVSHIGTLSRHSEPRQPAPMRYSSYAGCAGTWFNDIGQLRPPPTGTRSERRLYAYSVTKLASITDGTSNTLMFGEHTRLIENSTDQVCWHWWTSGNYGDTIFTTFCPINPQKKLPYSCQGVSADPAGRGRIKPASRWCQFRHDGRLGPVHQRLDQLVADQSLIPPTALAPASAYGLSVTTSMRAIPRSGS